VTRDEKHPAWDVYDLYRTARLNVKYFCGRLAKLQRLNFWIEFTLAATASSSAIAAFTLWQTRFGGKIWQTLGAIAAILAILKPLLNLTEKIRKLEEVITGYRVLEHDLKKIEASINQRKTYDKELSDRFLSALDRMDQLIVKYSEPTEDKKLKARCQDEVLRELPVDHFYIPGGSSDAK
jgi:hypothetical protein